MNNKRRELLLFFIIIFLGLLTSTVLGFLNGGFVDKGLISFNKIALSILHDFSFHDEDMLFPAFFRRPPGYPVVLSLSYLIFGERYFSVVVLNMILWLFGITLFWRISRHFLRGYSALLPPLMLSLFWGAATYVFSTNSDLFALFFTILFVWAFILYQEKKTTRWVFVQALALVFLTLTKPIILYALPVLVLLFILFNKPFSRRMLIGGIFCLLIIITLIGSWSLYSYRLLNTFQLSSGALTLLRRADDVHMSPKRIQAFLLSSLVGDYVADKVFPGYANDPEPVTKKTVEREKKYQALLAKDRSNDTEIQRLAYKESLSLIRESPSKFFLLGFIYLIRIHMPVNHSGIDLSHLFVGTHNAFSEMQKTFLVIGIFLYTLIES